MAQLRLAEEKDERPRSTGTWDAANATCFTLLTSPTYCGSFLIGSLKVPQMKFKKGTRICTAIPMLYELTSVKSMTWCSNTARDTKRSFNLRTYRILLAHYRWLYTTTQSVCNNGPGKKENKKIIFKHFCQFSRWPRRRARRAWSTSALRQPQLFLYVENFKQSFSGFPSLYKLAPFAPCIGLLFFTGICTKS